MVADQRSGALLAGAGKAEVDLPPGVPLAGFRPFGRPAAGPDRAPFPEEVAARIETLLLATARR